MNWDPFYPTYALLEHILQIMGLQMKNVPGFVTRVSGVPQGRFPQCKSLVFPGSSVPSKGLPPQHAQIYVKLKEAQIVLPVMVNLIFMILFCLFFVFVFVFCFLFLFLFLN